jgi:hypothetical protein
MKKQAPSARKGRPSRRRVLYAVGFGIILLYLIFKIGSDFSRSLFVTRPDRVNILVYGETPTFYSFGIRDVGNYAITFYPDLRVQVPGGYGYYRIGALGKLATLQDDPKLLSSAFTAVTSTFVDYSFLNPSGEVFYGGRDETRNAGKPSNWDIFRMRSNAAFFDKIYLMTLMNQIQPNSVHDIDYLPYEKAKNDTVFNEDNFLDRYIGVFYRKTYREDNRNVQLLYSNSGSYNTAEMISSVLNGNGILVGDISRRKNAKKQCRVIEEGSEPYSRTAVMIAEFFDCRLERGDTDVYDILFELGSLEDSWEID